MDENKVSNLFETTLGSLKGVADSNTVMGEPITTPGGVTIIPVSKFSIGFAGGGTDFGSKKDPTGRKNFGGGGGSGVTATPVGFVVIDSCGNVKFLSVKNDENGSDSMTVSDLAEKIPQAVSKIKEMFAKKKEEKASESEKANAEASSGETKTDAE